MNKVFNINVGGLPFIIDDDAFVALENYINTIKNHFKHSEGSDEIITDIEARIAELLTDKLKEKQIVSMGEVEHIISVMGRPTDFGVPDYENQASDTEEILTKRLYRDPTDKLIGGVCSGLSAYFGFKDPIWMRLLFAIVFMFGGLSLMVYIILWIFVPLARTPHEKLAMHGEPVNINSIAKKVEEELHNLSKTINDLTRDYKKKT